MNIRRCSKKRNIAHVIGPHIKPLMQLMSNDFPQYNMKLQTTKCLNTGIMLCLSLLGVKGLEMINYCDANTTTIRHKEGQDDNNQILESLHKQLFSKRERKSQLYYILLTDGYFPTQTGSNKYFPGHVILIEKHLDEKTNQHIYTLHQSYINEYDLQTFAKTSKTSFTREELEEQVFKGIRLALISPTWTASVVEAWKQLTNVDTSTFITSRSYQQFFICFRKYELSAHLKPLKKYIEKKLLHMRSKHVLDNEVYGNKTLYDNPSDAFTNKHIQMHLRKLHDNLQVC